MPLQYILIEHPDSEDPHTDTVRLWRNEDAARCRACAPGKCNFLPNREGVGLCRTRRDGLPSSA
jgi:hypothetical protein